MLSSAMAALVAIFGKLGLKDINPTWATSLRSVIMAVFLVSVSLIMVALKKLPSIAFSSLTSRDWWLIVLAGVSGAISWLFYFVALKTGPATQVVVIDRLSLVFVIILAAIFLGESLTWKTGIGAVLMVSGALLVVLK